MTTDATATSDQTEPQQKKTRKAKYRSWGKCLECGERFQRARRTKKWCSARCKKRWQRNASWEEKEKRESELNK